MIPKAHSMQILAVCHVTRLVNKITWGLKCRILDFAPDEVENAMHSGSRKDHLRLNVTMERTSTADTLLLKA